MRPASELTLCLGALLLPALGSCRDAPPRKVPNVDTTDGAAPSSALTLADPASLPPQAPLPAASDVAREAPVVRVTLLTDAGSDTDWATTLNQLERTFRRCASKTGGQEYGVTEVVIPVGRNGEPLSVAAENSRGLSNDSIGCVKMHVVASLFPPQKAPTQVRLRISFGDS